MNLRELTDSARRAHRDRLFTADGYEFIGGVRQAVFNQLYSPRVHREGMILKPTMLISGKKASSRASRMEEAVATEGLTTLGQYSVAGEQEAACVRHT